MCAGQGCEREPDITLRMAKPPSRHAAYLRESCQSNVHFTSHTARARAVNKTAYSTM
jgi:hypothetical protein